MSRVSFVSLVIYKYEIYSLNYFSTFLSFPIYLFTYSLIYYTLIYIVTFFHTYKDYVET